MTDRDERRIRFAVGLTWLAAAMALAAVAILVIGVVSWWGGPL